MPYQVTYVIGVTDPIERAACIGKVLKSLCRIDADWLRVHKEAPLLRDAGVKIIPEPRDTDIWHDLPAILRTRQATQPEWACALAAERAVRGDGSRGVPVLRTVDDEQTRYTICTDLFDGEQERDLSHRVLAHMLVGLTELDALCLRRHPEWPGIYDGQVRYEEEPLGQEDWADIPTQDELGIADCFPEGTLLLRDDFELIPIEDVCVGDRIWGRDAWSIVEKKWGKGRLTVDSVRLSNGANLELTGDHHLFLARCEKHLVQCECSLVERKISRERIREISSHETVLLRPTTESHSKLRERLLKDVEKVTLVRPIRVAASRKDQFLRMQAVAKDARMAYCWDIQTSDHYVYLPEHDVTVSNCEDLACRRAAELNVRHGIRAYPTFVWRRRPSGSYLYHIITARPDMVQRCGVTQTWNEAVPTEDPSRALGMQ